VKLRETKSFFVQNISDIDRDFTIDHVVRKEWKLFPGAKEEPIAGPPAGAGELDGMENALLVGLSRLVALERRRRTRLQG